MITCPICSGSFKSTGSQRAKDENGVTREMCSVFCYDEMLERVQRKGADEQRGWKLKRWWNQQYKHRKAAFEQFKVEMEFKKIQRKARKERS